MSFQNSKNSTAQLKASLFSFGRGQLLVLVRRTTKHDAAKLQAFASFGQRVGHRAFLQRHTVIPSRGLQYPGTRRTKILPVRIRRQLQRTVERAADFSGNRMDPETEGSPH